MLSVIEELVRMFNIVKIVGGKKSNIRRQMIFALFLLLLVCFILQIGSAIYTKDYYAVPGYISDLTLYNTSYTRNGVRDHYYYIVHWYYEGEEYTKTQYSGFPVENVSEVWIDKDNSDVIINSPGELSKAAFTYGSISAALFVIWLIMYLKTENVEYNEDIAEDVFIDGALGTFVSLMAVLITAFVFNHEKGGDFGGEYTGMVLLLTSVVFLVVCVILTILAAVEKKRLSAGS